MNEEKQIYDNLLKNINVIISYLNDIFIKIDAVSKDFTDKYMINDIYGDNVLIDNSKNEIDNIKNFLSNEVRNELVEKINLINNRY